METFGAIAGLLLFVKIILHIYLASKVDKNFKLRYYLTNSLPEMGMMILPSMELVPEKYRLLKRFINILYFFSVGGIIFYLIWFNWLQPTHV